MARRPFLTRAERFRRAFCCAPGPSGPVAPIVPANFSYTIPATGWQQALFTVGGSQPITSFGVSGAPVGVSFSLIGQDLVIFVDGGSVAQGTSDITLTFENAAGSSSVVLTLTLAEPQESYTLVFRNSPGPWTESLTVKGQTFTATDAPARYNAILQIMAQISTPTNLYGYLNWTGSVGAGTDEQLFSVYIYEFEGAGNMQPITATGGIEETHAGYFVPSDPVEPPGTPPSYVNTEEYVTVGVPISKTYGPATGTPEPTATLSDAAPWLTFTALGGGQWRWTGTPPAVNHFAGVVTLQNTAGSTTGVNGYQAVLPLEVGPDWPYETNGTAGAPVNVTYAATNGGSIAPYTIELDPNGGPLPGTLTFTDNGNGTYTLSGTMPPLGGGNVAISGDPNWYRYVIRVRGSRPDDEYNEYTASPYIKSAP